MAVIIRKARPSDAKGIADAFNESLERGLSPYTGANEPCGAKEIRGLAKKFAAKNRNELTFVAVDARTKQLLGSYNFYAEPNGRTRHRGELVWAVVHPGHRRKAIATKLLKATLKEVKQRGFKKVFAVAAVLNIASIRLAKNCGFRIEGRSGRASFSTMGRMLTPA